jgi:hypothetical protein
LIADFSGDTAEEAKSPTPGLRLQPDLQHQRRLPRMRDAAPAKAAMIE